VYKVQYAGYRETGIFEDIGKIPEMGEAFLQKMQGKQVSRFRDLFLFSKPLYFFHIRNKNSYKTMECLDL